MQLPQSNTMEWLAGFFDGEGCAHVTTRHYTRTNGNLSTYTTRTMVVANNVRAACEAFQRELGGYVYEVRPGHYQWRANNQEAVEAALKLLPHLRVKTEQVQSMLAGVNMRMPTAKAA